MYLKEYIQYLKKLINTTMNREEANHISDDNKMICDERLSEIIKIFKPFRNTSQNFSHCTNFYNTLLCILPHFALYVSV